MGVEEGFYGEYTVKELQILGIGANLSYFLSNKASW